MAKDPGLLKNQFDYDLDTDIAELRELALITEIYVHENGLVGFGRIEPTEQYVIFIRTPGFRGRFEYRDHGHTLRAWNQAKKDLDSGNYGPWEKNLTRRGARFN